jgi:cytosine/adenosine deaminase-related metal-dependent hydrolase
MSQKNVEIERQFIEAARSGGVQAIEAFVAVSDPSIEHTRLPAASGPDTYCGHDGARRWFTDMADLWRKWRNEIEEVVEVGPDTVAARQHSPVEVLEAERVFPHPRDALTGIARGW